MTISVLFFLSHNENQDQKMAYFNEIIAITKNLLILNNVKSSFITCMYYKEICNYITLEIGNIMG